MNKVCPQCSTQFTVTDDDLEFYTKVSPVFAGKQYLISPPTLCHNCALKRRLSWRNDRYFYERKCNKSGADLISMFRPDSKVNVISKELWWQDDWDAKDYGQEFDFTKPFFEQFQSLIERVPHSHIITFDSVNSLYTNYNGFNKNCYLCAAGNHLEDSYYCYNAQNSKNCCDCFFVYNCELCYQCIHCEKCYNTDFAINSQNCADCSFIEDCTSCQNCFLCFNLTHKSYCILNQQYTKAEYEKILETYHLDTLEGQEKAFQLWRTESLKYPKRANQNKQTEDCIGEYILQSKNCQECFIMAPGCEDCRYVFNGFPNLKDSNDCSYSGENASLLYECMGSGANISTIAFGYLCLMESSNLLYCSNMFSSKNCFGCSNMRKAEYCILNKQYTKEEYEALVPQIIEHMQKTSEWGEFFPDQISPFHYDETTASEYFPQTEAQATTRPFQTIKQELEFYQRKNLPIPTEHPTNRHLKRLALCNAPQFWERNCAKCQTVIHTSFSPQSPAIVYCEQCYQELVY